MKKIILTQPGPPETLQLVEAEDPVPEGDQVLVNIRAVGLNWSETMIRRGDWPMDLTGGFVLGAEGAGIVESVGPDVRRVRPGERVAVLDVDAYRISGQGTYAEKIAVSENKVLAFPSQFDFSQAAALPMAWLTAYDAMIHHSPLPESGNVLVTASTGVVGIAALQISGLKGLRAIGTTRSEGNKEKLSDMGFSVAVGDNPNSLSEQVKSLVGERGIDYVLDPIGGETLKQLLESVNLDGTCVVYGLLENGSVDLSGTFLFKQIKIHGYVVLRNLEDSQVLQNIWQEILPILEEYAFEIPVAKTFPFEKAHEAHRYMEECSHVGKLVLVR